MLGVGALAWALWLGSATPMPDAVRIPPVASRPKGSSLPPALFRHGSHGQFTCYACHPSLFPQYPEGFTHAQMHDGGYCGACHEGTAAFSIREAACEACHVPR